MNASFDEIKQTPFSMEAEQSVLGAIFMDPERYGDVTGVLTSEDFYLEYHKEIFSGMTELYSASRHIDVVTLLDILVKRGVYDEAGGKAYVRSLAETTPTTSNIKEYAAIVRDKSLLRSLIAASQEISVMAHEGTDEARKIVDHSEQLIFSIAQGVHTQSFVHIRDILVTTYDSLQRLISDKDSATGAKTGFTGVDRVLVGMGAGDLVLIGARPGMGKTSFALNIATNMAKKTGKAVCVFSLEMSKEQLTQRLLSSEAFVDNYKLRSGDLSEEDWVSLAKASSVLSECDILIDDSTGITVTEMKAKLRRVKNLGLVIIDYLQLMQSDRKIDNRVQEVADISRNLKILAKDLGVPVITCAQLSRGPESRTDKRPMLSDLRDSGAIEQDADIVMFLYRNEYYKEDTENQNTAEIIIAKNRHGSTGNVKMGWQGQFTRFITREEDREPEK